MMALDAQVGNYGLLYQTIIALMTYLPIQFEYSYKIFSIFFDYALAIVSALMVKEYSGSRIKSLVQCIASFARHNRKLCHSSINIYNILINLTEHLACCSSRSSHRAKEEFESDEGKAILRELGIEGNYEGIGHLILGYAAKPENAPAPRKENYVYRV